MFFSQRLYKILFFIHWYLYLISRKLLTLRHFATEKLNGKLQLTPNKQWTGPKKKNTLYIALLRQHAVRLLKTGRSCAKKLGKYAKYIGLYGPRAEIRIVRTGSSSTLSRTRRVRGRERFRANCRRSRSRHSRTKIGSLFVLYPTPSERANSRARAAKLYKNWSTRRHYFRSAAAAIQY